MKKNKHEEQLRESLSHSHHLLSSAVANYISSLLSLLDICFQSTMSKEENIYCKVQILSILQTSLQIDRVSHRKKLLFTTDLHSEESMDKELDQLIDLIDEYKEEDPQAFLTNIRRSLYQKVDRTEERQKKAIKHISTGNSPPPWINQKMNKKK
ncbi:hypothetical protein [Bacillus taeanensis]|uniref:Uncharacterized protein n=1 Tax=Bacillus taeanensis TaxID=273032 RepID=A0A366Y1A6_9BACI|nr:hypothetical protein [Bacillus taeanensis]RBW69961.1 hypothetical protein DS031_08895 [Bacillus taeanensis]